MRSPLTISKDLLIIALISLAVTFGHAVRGYAQDKPEPGKDEKTVTLKIIKNEDGKVTVIDTTITTNGEKKAYQYEYTLRDLDEQMHEAEEQMKGLNGQMFFGDNEDFEGMVMPAPPMPPQWEALLQSIPMGRITGFQVKDRKDGKRIIIDVDDDYPVVIMAPYQHRYMKHGGKNIIIERGINDIPPPPPPPPPPPAEQKEPAPKPHKG